MEKDLSVFIEKYIDDHTDDISALLLELVDETEEACNYSDDAKEDGYAS